MKKVALLALLACAVLTGCATSRVTSASSPSASVAVTPSSTAAGSPPFTGPYAQVLADVYGKSHTAFERDALSDGKITDAEHAEMIERFRTCLASNGHRLDWYKKTGSHEITALDKDEDSDVGRKQIESCDKFAGVNTVGLIYSAMLTNPHNVDVVPKIVACFKKHHLVSPSYSTSDYQEGLPTFSDRKKNAQVQQCNEDPLNITKGK
ncbi:hypothetical protein [Leifsonia xyli]|uniref:hypothetical protein n=1 Tax=Leifsonia xyli TaxID=1575 RepID=UPI003D68005B